jgi:hypothetical protein
MGVISHKIDTGSDSWDKEVTRGERLRGACPQLAAHTVQTGVQKQEVCSTVLSEDTVPKPVYQFEWLGSFIHPQSLNLAL